MRHLLRLAQGGREDPRCYNLDHGAGESEDDGLMEHAECQDIHPEATRIVEPEARGDTESDACPHLHAAHTACAERAILADGTNDARAGEDHRTGCEHPLEEGGEHEIIDREKWRHKPHCHQEESDIGEHLNDGT